MSNVPKSISIRTIKIARLLFLVSLIIGLWLGPTTAEAARIATYAVTITVLMGVMTRKEITRQPKYIAIVHGIHPNLKGTKIYKPTTDNPRRLVTNILLSAVSILAFGKNITIMTDRPEYVYRVLSNMGLNVHSTSADRLVLRAIDNSHLKKEVYNENTRI